MGCCNAISLFLPPSLPSQRRRSARRTCLSLARDLLPPLLTATLKPEAVEEEVPAAGGTRRSPRERADTALPSVRSQTLVATAAAVGGARRRREGQGHHSVRPRCPRRRRKERSPWRRGSCPRGSWSKNVGTLSSSSSTTTECDLVVYVHHPARLFQLTLLFLFSTQWFFFL